MSASLSTGWTETTLGEVADLNPRSFTSEVAEEDIVSFVPMAAVEEESGRLDASRGRRWIEVRKGYTPFEENDVLFAKITPCMENGKYAVARGLIGGRGAGSTEFHVLRPTAAVSSDLLLYFLLQKDVRRSARMKMKGAAGQLRVPPEFLSDLRLSLPPRPEQDRIVAEIEKQLTRLDAAVTALKRVQANVRRYRASVLKAACEGRLVPTEAELARREGRIYETGEELLARILQERRAKWEAGQLAKMQAAGKPPKDDSWKRKYKEPAPPDTTNLPVLPEGWAWASVEQCNPADRPCAYGVLQPGGNVDDGVPFVRVGDIEDGRIALANLKRILPTIAAAYPRTRLRGGEVLLTLVGAIGRTAVVPNTLADGNTARAVAVIPIVPEVRPRWVELWFRNPDRVVEMTMKSHEVARKTLNLEDVRSATVALPPLAEQHRIIESAEGTLSINQVVADTVRRLAHRTDRLRQAILKRAFEGKLVPQDPNDEPASVLLERIRAERTNSNSIKKPMVRRRRVAAATSVEP